MDQDVLSLLNTLLLVFSFILGSTIGSFLNVCVHRMPKGLSVVSPRSRCPQCENSIAWYDNIPILSWLILGAKCRNCGLPISWQYPLVEALTGALFFLVYWKFELTVASPIYMALCAGLVLVTFIDLTDWTIPNEITLPGMPIGLACAVLAMMMPGTGLLLDDPLWSIAGWLAGGGFLYALDKISLLLLGKRGMGFGDVKLMAMLGAFFGLAGAALIMVIASVVGSVVGITMLAMHKKKEGAPEEGNYLPFGPYIALGGVIYLLVGPALIDWYLGYLNLPPEGVTPIM